MTVTSGANAGTYWYHFDALESVAALSQYNSGSGVASIVERYRYSAFGETTVTLNGNTGNPYRFTGRRWDDETELYYYRARYYKPDLGRFLQPDPIGYTDGMNMYAYVGNNPLGFVDPYGLRQWSGLFRPNAMVRITTEGSNTTKRHHISDATDIVMVLIEHSVSGDKIAGFEYYGHGEPGGLNVEIKDKKNYITGIYSKGHYIAADNQNTYSLDILEDVIKGAFHRCKNFFSCL